MTLSDRDKRALLLLAVGVGGLFVLWLILSVWNGGGLRRSRPSPCRKKS